MPEQLTPEETRARLDDDEFTLVDIRGPDAYADGHVPDAENLTPPQLQQVVADREWTDAVAFICYVGKSSKQAADFVERYGDVDEVYSVAGGFDAWDGETATEG